MSAPTRPDQYERNFAVQAIERTLRGYGVLTRKRLAERSKASHWPDPWMFDNALCRAVSQGRIASLEGDLYELSGSQRPAHDRLRAP